MCVTALATKGYGLEREKEQAYWLINQKNIPDKITPQFYPPSFDLDPMKCFYSILFSAKSSKAHFATFVFLTLKRKGTYYYSILLFNNDMARPLFLIIGKLLLKSWCRLIHTINCRTFFLSIIGPKVAK